MFDIQKATDRIVHSPISPLSKIQRLRDLQEKLNRFATAEFKRGRFSEGEDFEWCAECAGIEIENVRDSLSGS